MSERLGLRVRHHTGFSYAGYASASYNEARVTPRSGPGQRVSTSQVSLSPNVPLATYVDYFGTVVTTFDVQEPHERLDVEATSALESWAPPRPVALDWRELRDPRLRDRYAEYLTATPRTSLDSVGIDPRDVAGGGVHDVVDTLCEWVRGWITYEPGSTSVSATAAEVWNSRRGVCQDITHVTIALLRRLDIPARYVSGYLYPGRDPEVGEWIAGESHAWVEYFAGEWTGVDPTNGVAETARHVVVGHGRDYDDVAPLRGIYQGPHASGLGVVVEMTRVH